MTPFEAQSLDVAREQLWAFGIADVIAFLALITAILGGFIAYRNVRAILDQLTAARWNSLLSFEQDMATRRTKFSDIAVEMATNPAGPFTKERYAEAKESYLNSLDRLASSILNGHFPDAEMKQDYREVITNVVREFRQDFDTGTHYRKVVKLYNKWAD